MRKASLQTQNSAMEIEDGSRTRLIEGSEVVFGRGNGFNCNDRAVSRRHISFKLTSPGPRISFEAVGKNPISVRIRESGEIRIFMRSEKGELSVGDSFCVSGRNLVWFSLKMVGGNGSEIQEERELGDDGLDLEVSSESG